MIINTPGMLIIETSVCNYFHWYIECCMYTYGMWIHANACISVCKNAYYRLVYEEYNIYTNTAIRNAHVYTYLSHAFLPN